jgi:3-methylcrotonyl-CoA carboxylase alpha subunit
MGNLHVELEGESLSAAPVSHCYHDTNTGIVHLSIRGRQVTVSAVDQLARATGGEAGGATILAPMTGRIARVLVRAGDSVTRGAPLVVVEAMKMEHILRAGINGRVTALPAAEGMQVAEGSLLCRLEPVSS